MDLALAYLFFYGYLSKSLEVIKPMLEMLIVLTLVSMLVCIINLKVDNIYPLHLTYAWEGISAFILIVTVILYRSNVSR